MMSPATSTRKTVVCLDSLNPEHLREENALEIALFDLQNVLSEDNFQFVIEDMLSKPYLVELIISAIDNSSLLCGWIMHRFPTSARSFLSSPISRLLSSVSLFLCFLDCSFPDIVSRGINEHRRSVELALPVLEVLVSSMDPMSDAIGERIEFQDSLANVKPKIRKNKGTRQRDVSTVDDKHFRNLGVPVPSTRRDAEALSSEILRGQKTALEFYLKTLRLPGVSKAAEMVYISQTTPTSVATLADADMTVQPSNEDIPLAYPKIQPMKAALYFDSPKELGDWGILIASRADRKLRETRRKDPASFKIIIKKIKELSNGHFSDDNQKRLNGPNVDIPIYEAKMTRDLRLVYQVDCIPEYGSEVERQVLRIYGVYTHAQLKAHLWDSLAHHLRDKGKEYRRRCTFRNRQRHNGDNNIMPASFPPSAEMGSQQSSNIPELRSEDLEEISLLVLDKYVTFSQALLNSLVVDLDVEHVFHLTPQEKEIIDHTNSCYVLGRSGTGKTTVMLFKMLGMERSWELCDNKDMNKPRQVFVTKSPTLAKKVSEYYYKLSDSLTMANLSRKELAKLKQSQRMGEGLVKCEDNPHSHQDLPPRFSLLNDENFPLFLAFDELCKLLEADVELGYCLTKDEGSYPEGASITPQGGNTAVSSGHYQLRSRTLISYDRFLEHYWPHFSQGLTKGLYPSLVYSEFMGVIKGSKETLTREERFLDRDSYEKLSPRSYPTFASQRDTIYSLFQMYVKQKREQGDYDVADRTYSILQVIQERGVPGQKIDYLYVDEAQDNLLIDAFLLRLLCRNSNGLFWAGDTAQTIAIGSSFTFNELKSFLFQIELRRRRSNEINLPQTLEEPPRTFQLTVNYRSHGGIVNCAHSIIELVTMFWPSTIDTLAREKGMVEGVKPIFFSSMDQVDAIHEQFLSDLSGSHIGLGAKQCILVRDEVAKTKFKRKLGNIGTILTLHEAKGLEFEDVLLYDFFKDSAADISQWRIVLNGLNESQSKISAPRFDDTHHACICSELKFLYVAITRAMKNIWIVDCSEKRQAMQLFWTIKGHIQNYPSGIEVPVLAVSSSPEEWASQGKIFFDHERYSQAVHCFERASLYREASVADAFRLREKALTIPALPRQSSIKRSDAFVTAANAFLKCAAFETKYFRCAGDCFDHGDDILKAANAYRNGQEYTRLAQLYHSRGIFDVALNVVRSHGDKMQSEVVKSIIADGRLFYLRENMLDLRRARELFYSYGEELKFMEEHHFDDARAKLLESLGRYEDAADIHLRNGRTLVAIPLFLKDKSPAAIKYILQELWKHLTFGVTREFARNATVIDLFVFAGQLNFEISESSRAEISMFQAISSGDSAKLLQLGRHFHKVKNRPLALFCLDHLFVNPPQVQALSGQDLTTVLNNFFIYTSLLQDVSAFDDPRTSTPVQTLFGIQILTPTEFLLPAGTFLNRSLADSTSYVLSGNKGGKVISAWGLLQVFKQSLRDRLKRRTMQENEMCCQAKAFSLCLPFAVFAKCDGIDSDCPLEHVQGATLDSRRYNIRIRLHLQQILIIRSLQTVGSVPELPTLRQYWIDRLYDALNPPHYLIGNFANLDMSIPEARRGFQTVEHWVQDKSHSDSTPLLFWTSILKAANFGFTNHWNGSLCKTEYGPPDESIIGCILDSLEGSKHSCLSASLWLLWHIIQNKLPVNVVVLCDFIDHLCGSLIVTQMSCLQDVTIPRSWILRFPRTFQYVGKRDATLFGMLIKPLAVLLNYLYRGDINSAKLLYQGTDLSDSALKPLFRSVFISRICRTLCLLGYNIKQASLQKEILRTMMSLRDVDRQFPADCQSRYVNADRWEDIASVVRCSTVGSAMDELILLCHSSRVEGSAIAVHGVRRVIYSEVEDIPFALRKYDPHRRRSPRHGSSQLGHRPLPICDNEANSGTRVSTAISSPISIPLAHSEEKIYAVCLIQRAYQRVLCRRKGTSNAGFAAIRDTIFNTGWVEVRKMEWPKDRYHRLYRFLFLGPLVHVLLCLQVVQRFIPLFTDHKEGLKSASNPKELERWEKLQAETDILRELKRLQDALGHNASIHRHCNLGQLMARVLAVEDLIRRLPIGSTHDMRENIQLGVEGTVKIIQMLKREARSLSS